jgi:CxxC motif-containing protein (DUF1111 family)
MAAVVGLAWCGMTVTAKEEAAGAKDKPRAEAKADGYELFVREWLPGDERAAKGDGLGPVFNDTSCVACHNQGGPGGAGPATKNVDVITVFANPHTQQQHHMPATLPEAMFRAIFGDAGRAAPPAESKPSTETGAAQETDAKKALVKQQREELQKIHPGFLSARSVVLHKSGTDDKYEAWRAQMRGEGHFLQTASFNNNTVVFASPAPVATLTLTDTVVDVPATAVEAVAEVATATTASAAEATVEVQPVAVDARTMQAQQLVNQHRMLTQQFRSFTQATSAQVGNFFFTGTQRNPTALFGAGAIDAIPDEVIRENAKKKHKEFPEVQGRVAKLKDGRIGRFGWKNQTATLYDFTMTACAIELGLDVPDHPQAGVPHQQDYKSPGNDLTKAEANALVDYLRKLPAPMRDKPANKQQEEYLAAGERHFVAVGCATCHTNDLGDVKGIYSDLLLHDMGEDLGDTGSYGIFIPNSPEEGGDEPVPSLASQRGGGIFGGGQQKIDREKVVGALRSEWRTPPLWGLRDSGPYLHDGRAQTLEQAIALHGGEATRIGQRFFELSRAEQMQMLAFLKSLRAPDVQVASR